MLNLSRKCCKLVRRLTLLYTVFTTPSLCGVAHIITPGSWPGAKNARSDVCDAPLDNYGEVYGDFPLIITFLGLKQCDLPRYRLENNTLDTTRHRIRPRTGLACFVCAPS